MIVRVKEIQYKMIKWLLQVKEFHLLVVLVNLTLITIKIAIMPSSKFKRFYKFHSIYLLIVSF